ncbi:MAG: TetR/AcrR family transcriptional regulator [Nitrososphaerales archaeon]
MAKKAMTKPRTQEERSQQTREAILEAAGQCVRELGYAKVRLADIARAAQLTTGALQHHFADKDELMRSVAISAFEQIEHTVTSVGEQPGTLNQRITACVALMTSIYESSRVLAAFEIIYATREDPAYRESLQEALMHYDRLIDDAWVKLFKDTGLKPARLVAIRHFARTAIQGMVMQKQMNPRFNHKEVLDLLTAALAFQLGK